jgi:hypothetical protein
MRTKYHGNKFSSTFHKGHKKCVIVDTEDFYLKQNSHGLKTKTKKSSNSLASMDKTGNLLLFIFKVIN